MVLLSFANSHLVVSLLVTDPAYQGRGLGKLLMKQGLDRADAEGRKVYIESTSAGHPLYLKLGFKDVDIMEIDLSKYGGTKPGKNWIMVREPQPVSQ
jgi:GNAT superfamily N-acetyltransferase